MNVSVGSLKARRLLLLGIALVCGLLIEQAAWNWRVRADMDSHNLSSLERATRLAPGNAEAWDRLGRFRQLSFEHPDAAGAVRDYERAVSDLPISPYYLMDLAGAYKQTGHIEEANRAFERAVAAYPLSGAVAWNYGNFLLRQQRMEQGLEEIHRAVKGDPSLIPLALSRVWTSNHDIDLVLDRLLPSTATAYLEALNYFESTQEVDAGIAVWDRLLSLGQPVGLRSAFPLIDELIRGDRASDARKVWLGAVRAAGVNETQPDSSLIWNGEFMQAFANGGLGWRWDSPLGADINFGDPRPGGRGRSVRIDFNGGNNTALDAPSQYVPVEPNTLYDFHAYLRTEGITTESGIRFAISDPNHSGVSVTTTNLTGTNPWAAADAQVTTGPQTHFLLVQLYRPRSRLFDSNLGGTVWMADVSLVPAQAHAEPGKP